MSSPVEAVQLLEGTGWRPVGQAGKKNCRVKGEGKEEGGTQRTEGGEEERERVLRCCESARKKDSPVERERRRRRRGKRRVQVWLRPLK